MLDRKCRPGPTSTGVYRVRSEAAAFTNRIFTRGATNSSESLKDLPQLVRKEVLRKVKLSFPYVRSVVHVPHVRGINDNLERTTIHNVVIFEK